MSEAASSRKNMSQPAPSIGGTVTPEHRPLPVEHRPAGYVPPFGVRIAKRGDNDDTACWVVADGSVVVLQLGADESALVGGTAPVDPR